MHGLSLRLNALFGDAVTAWRDGARDVRAAMDARVDARGERRDERGDDRDTRDTPLRGVFQLANARGCSRHFLLTYLIERVHTRPIVVICENARQAERTRAHAIAAYRLATERYEREEDFLLYPDLDSANLFEHCEPDIETTAQRTLVHDALFEGNAALIFTPVSAFFRKLSPRETVRGARLTLATKKKRAAQKVPLSMLVEKLTAFGYERVNLVFEPGQFSVRGGLVDVFPAGAQLPVRIDFFGDEIEEIGIFNPETQRSTERVDEIAILPARTKTLDQANAALLADAVEARLAAYVVEHGARLTASCAKLAEIVREDIERVRAGASCARQGFYAPAALYSATFLDYLPDGAVVYVHDEALVESELRSFERFWRDRFNGWRKSALGIYELSDYYSIPAKKLHTYFKNARYGNFGFVFSYSFDAPHSDSPAFDLELGTPSAMKYRLGYLTDAIKDLGARASEVWIASQFAERLKERIAEEGANVGAIERAILPGGFTFKDAGLLITDAEVFGEIEDASPVSKTRRFEKGGLKAVDEIKIGDYVVHVDYGIGRFVALSDQEVGGVTRSYVEIEYDGKDKLYVPVDQLDRLRRYRYDGAPPKLNNLGRSAWRKTKRKIRQESLKLALRLFKLYRRRRSISGISYSDREGWLDEFSSAFPYELTPDQLDAWNEVKADMETARPMERLICGDVGFGKTEIAQRAAFLACTNDKQVMILCPTTILADQHYHTFRRRFAPFPFRVEMLSRFLGKKEQQAIAADFSKGRVDVLIGTHRVLSKDVTPKSLGLLIIDEEQRFGVKQKEALKMRFAGVDSLTLTATPIPRTLHMALVGMRDVSLIETAPAERKPVRTFVGEYERELVRDAVLREMGRGGQVFYLHNRVLDMELARERLEELVPEAKLITAHGQMKEDSLEEVMNAFAMGAFNMLLSTTIIENGLDIPNVNTLVVENAENLGLAQMHQLRGRVGRSHLQAYAYFFHDPERGLTPDAQGRLHAIYNYAYLGAGYEIAQSDLRLRGAGNVFGEEQSGLAAAVGYDYYFELLADSATTLREMIGDLDSLDDIDEEALLDTFDIEPEGCIVDVPIPAFIPPAYIDDGVLRLDILRRIARLNADEIAEFKAELEDRFGAIPREVDNLLSVISIKSKAQSIGVTSVEYLRARKLFRFNFGDCRPSWAMKVTLLDGNAGLKDGSQIEYTLPLDDDTPDRLVSFLDRLIRLKTAPA